MRPWGHGAIGAHGPSGPRRQAAAWRAAAGRPAATGGEGQRRPDGGGRAISESAFKLQTILNYER